MRRLAFVFAFFFIAFLVRADVKTIGDMSFAVPDDWNYQPNSGFGSMTHVEGRSFWLMTLFAPMPSSGDAVADLKAAWTQIILLNKSYQGMPASIYQISHSIGYSGQYGDGSSLDRTSYTRMYVLEAGKRFIPVVTVSRDGVMLNSTQHVALDLIGSVRLAPLKAQPFGRTISIADLVGHWTCGVAGSYSFYNQQTGRYEGNASGFANSGYTIAADGGFKYQSVGMVNGGTMRENDAGVVELGGEFVIFRGQNHVTKYRFINITHALDGATVLTFLPGEVDPSRLDIIRDRAQWSRPPST